jgi:hypothetical protein
MKGIKGQLSSLPITDLMQWIDMNKKSGVLFISEEENSKCFCFEEGKLLMGASNKEGGRLGEFLAKEGYIKLDVLRKAVSDSQSKGASLIGYLVDNRIIPQEFLKVSIQQLAEDAFTDVLSWEGGSFEFMEDLPVMLANSPVTFSTNFIIFESVRKYDEMKKQKGMEEA